MPKTGSWQLYETIEAVLENAGGKYDVVLNFAEVGSSNNNSLFNMNWLAVVSAAPTVSSVAMNPDGEQRSTINSMQVVFDGDVDVPNEAVSVVQLTDATTSTNASVSTSVSTQFEDGKTTATIQFISHVRNANNALEDGNYQLTLDADLVTRDGFPMSKDYVVGDNANGDDKFYTLFGDINGDRIVNLFDFIQFRTAFGSNSSSPDYDPTMDFDGGGSIDLIDFSQFRGRYGKSL